MSHWGVWLGCHFPAGSIPVGDGDRVLPLSVGGNGYVLTVDLMDPNLLKWAALPAGGVSSLASAGGSITVSAATGAVDVSLNMGHQNNWTAQQDFAAHAFTVDLCTAVGAIVSTGPVSLASGAFTVDATGHAVAASLTASNGGDVTATGTDAGGTFNWATASVAPPTQAAVPPASGYFGVNPAAQTLCTPDNWVIIRINGTVYKVPAYLP